MMNDHQWGPAAAIAFGIAVAVAIGCVNSFIVVKLGVNSFIATLGMGSILSATQVIVSHNAQPLPPTSTGWNNFTQTDFVGFQIVVLYLLIIAFVLWWLTAHTPVGRYLTHAEVPPTNRALFDADLRGPGPAGAGLPRRDRGADATDLGRPARRERLRRRRSYDAATLAKATRD